MPFFDAPLHVVEQTSISANQSQPKSALVVHHVGLPSARAASVGWGRVGAAAVVGVVARGDVSFRDALGRDGRAGDVRGQVGRAGRGCWTSADLGR